MTLRPGQYQIGNLVFGRNTDYPINELNLNGYDVNTGDYQASGSDELRMTRDYFKPTSITFTIGVMDNFLLPSMAGFGAGNAVTDGKRALDDFVREWRADEIRLNWGALKPIKCRQNDNKTRVIYGRPGKLAVGKHSRKSEYAIAVAEYRRADTLSYSDEEYSVSGAPSAAGTTPISIARLDGQAPAWMRFLITGPINDPIIKFGSLFQIHLDYNVAAGKVLEVNSYPWSRRVILAPDNLNVSPLMIPPSPYLNEVVFPAGLSTGVGLSGSSTTGATNLSVLWREAYLYF